VIKSQDMAYVADLHIHSRFSGACSSQLNIPNLAKWGRMKGVELLGTGDALHPVYQQELKKDLVEAGNGVYECRGVQGDQGTKFIITAEISCIYSEYQKVRRIHLVLLFPSLDTAFKVSETLAKKGAKLASDGRPILGLSSKQICDLIWGVDPDILVIPAHVWTPWFSLYGSNSGYDSINECFGEFSDRIYAIETGLSSEPAMNWRIEELDDRSIVSFSDLHSLPRLARECTLFSGSLGFSGLTEALKKQKIIGTIEFFPEEGKYHYSGHRNCGVVYDPIQLAKNGTICPKCKRQLTVGVMQRVEDLAGRSEKELELYQENGVTKSKKFPNRPGFRMLVQLEEIIAEALGVAVKTQKVQNLYEKLVTELDTELKILTKVDPALIALASDERVAEGVKRVREGKIHIEPGYDNTYGIVKIWREDEGAAASEAESDDQVDLF
jgi:uncharacterized protein (TIGR00375 family)